LPDQDDYHESQWDGFESDEDFEDDGDAPSECLVCPVCGQWVHEDTQQCPACGDWIIPVYPQHPWRRIVWIVAAVLILIAFAAAMIR